MTTRFAISFAVVLAAVFFLGCPSATTPIGKPELKCNDDCKLHASANCDEDSCARGCRFILDRLVEHEGHHVVECVAKAAACDDPVWADCAAKIGTHADGGPPAPPLPRDDDEFGE
jgi:hypothetical protein